MQATKLLYCYAHEDKSLLDQLVRQLASLERLGLIAGWSDRDISGGQEWQHEIDQRMNTADIILLLISPDFIASDYCYGVELKRAMERHEAGEARVVPIILRPVYWQEMRFGQLQALPTEGKPVTDWPKRGQAFLNVVKGVRKVIEELPPVSEVCPYRGLEAFTEQDHKFFFGRERAVETVLKRLKNSPHFLALVGPSGSGKSSLVQAGVMNELRRGTTWLGAGKRLEKIIARPGSDPFAELTLQGLPGPSTNLTERVQAWLEYHPEKERLILIIDQFEEIWTLCSPQMTQDFTRELVALIRAPVSVTLILIIRDDFDHRLGKHDALADLVDRSRVRVPSTLRQSELKAIIEGPVRKERLHFTEGLVETIIEDILAASSAEVDGEIVTDNTILPLLEFALTQLWNAQQERQDREMTREDYNRIGRVSGGLTVWADEAFRKLGTRLQPLAHAIFTKLVHLGNEQQRIPHSRQRRTLSELYPKQKDSHLVIAQLAEARLLFTSRDPRDGEESVEIIHDVLLREWQQLRDWIAEDRSFLAWYQQFERRLQLWIETNPNDFLLRDEGRLLGGRDLEDAEHWMVERPLDFNPEQQDFIMFSRKAVERQQQALGARQLATQAEVLQNQKTHYLQRSVLLAVEAMLHFPCLEADQALRSRLAMFPRPVALLQHSLKDVRAVAFSPDGRYLATAGGDHTARVWEVSTGREITRIRHGRELYSGGPIFGEVNAVAFSPDGRYVASAGDDRMAYVHEVLSGKRVASMTHEGGYVGAVIFSPDGSYLATASGDRTARVWKVTSGEEVVRLTHDGIVKAVAFSPDGRYMATASDDGTAQVWDTSCREIIAHIALGETVNDPEKQALNAVAFSPDGHYLAVGGRKKILDGIIVIWDTSSHSEVRRIEFEGTYGVSLPNATVNAIMFSPDGHSLVTANEDWTARLWDVTTGRQLQQFAHEGYYFNINAVYDIAFSPDGRYLATASGDGTTGIWETQSGRQIACLTGGISVRAVAFSPDGHYIATAGYDQAARLWKMPDKSSLFCLSHFGPVYTVAVSPDGRSIATGSLDRTAMMLASINDQEKGEKTTIKGQLKAYVSHQKRIIAIALSPDGRYLATASADHTAGVWQLSDGSLLHSLKHEEEVVDVTFSPDSNYLATASSDHTAGVWNTENGQLYFRIHHTRAVSAVAFSPDGTLIATASDDWTTKIWEITTGQEKAHLRHDHLNNTHGSSARLLDVSFSPDGHHLVTAGGTDNAMAGMWGDTTIKAGAATIWDISDGFKVAHLLLHRLEIRAVAFSPDGRYLATASNDGTAGLWEVSSGRQLASLAHKEAVHAVAFSHNGNYLATASWDGTAGIWEVPTGRQIARVAHENRVYAAIFSLDDQYLITASEDSTVQVWLWQPQDLVTEASSRLTYDFTQQEWRVYMGNEPYQRTRHRPLEVQSLAEANRAGTTDEMDSSFEDDEIGLSIMHIRYGRARRADIESLIQSGVACLERLIKETKMIKGGDSGKARDDIFASIAAEEAVPIVMPLIQDNDRDIRQVAALSLCRFQYQDVHKIGNAIGAIGSVLRRAAYDDSSEGDKWRLNAAVDTLKERREKEFHETAGERDNNKVYTMDSANPVQAQVFDAQTIKSNEDNLSDQVQEKQELAHPKGDLALLTEQAKQALLFAGKEARNFQQNSVGTEHLLLGLLDEIEGGAVKLLNELGAEPEKLRSALEFIMSRGNQNISGEIGLAPRAKKAIELAVDEAHRLKHHSIGTEHLLLGLVREGEGIAAGILENLGINLEKVRTQTIQLLHRSESIEEPETR